MTNEEFLASISIDGEAWKEIPGLEGFYMASTEGRILSMGRYIQRRGTDIAVYKQPKLKTPSRGRTGYSMLTIWMNGLQKTAYLAVLVAKTFIPNPEGKPCVDHIDTDKSNNKVSNLRWCTYWENLHNPITEKHRKGHNPDQSNRYIPVVALKNGHAVKRYLSITDAVNDGYHKFCIRSVCKGIRKSHGGLQWMYLEDYERSNSSSTSRE